MAPGIGIRIWNPPLKSAVAEVIGTVVEVTVPDAIGLDGKSIPYKTVTGNMLVRMLGRAQNATRPLTITVKFNGTPLVQKAFYVEAGAGGAFVGIWSLTSVPPVTGTILINCGTNNAGCAAIRIGEIAGAPVQVTAGAIAGYRYARALIPGNTILLTGGCTDATASPFTSTDMTTQWGVQIPAQTQLPNRTNGLAGIFGLSSDVAPDGSYDIATKAAIGGVIAAIEITP